MRYSKVLVANLCSLMLIGMSSSALAVDVTSKGDVEFKPNSDIIQPVDPGGDGDIDPNEPPTEGPLSINYASDFVFGAHKKTLKEQIFYAKEDTVTVVETGVEKTTPNFVQVTDLRGTAAGWTLAVRQNGPLKKENGVAVVGAKLTLSARSMASMYGFTDVPSGLTTDEVLSEGGQSHQVVTAEAGTGISTWNAFLGTAGDETSGVKLTVPKGSVKEIGVYTTSLTWVLQDVL